MCTCESIVDICAECKQAYDYAESWHNVGGDEENNKLK